MVTQEEPDATYGCPAFWSTLAKAFRLQLPQQWDAQQSPLDWLGAGQVAYVETQVEYAPSPLRPYLLRYKDVGWQ
jgi:hypothetical protein